VAMFTQCGVTRRRRGVDGSRMREKKSKKGVREGSGRRHFRSIPLPLPPSIIILIDDKIHDLDLPVDWW